MFRRLADFGYQHLSWQKVKGIVHLFNLLDHLFSVIILIMLIPLKYYWTKVIDADNQSQPPGTMTISLLYDSIRIATGRVDAAFDYIKKLNQSLNSTQESVSRIRLIPENTSHKHPSMNWKLKNTLHYVREIVKMDSQIVHLHYTVGAYKSGLAIYFVPLFVRFFNPRPRLVVTYHQFTEHKPSSFFFRSLLLLLCLSVDGYIFFRDDHIRSFVWGATFLNKNFTLIPTPSNIEFEALKSNSRHSLSISYPSTSDLSHFGTIRPGKGLEILIRAFRVVHEKHPGVKLTIAGAIDVVYQQKLIREISTYKLNDFIFFTGQLTPAQLYDRLSGTIVVLPFPDGASTYRTSLMAALNMGFPVVTTKSKDTPEIFEDGKNIFLAGSNSYNDLARIIDKVISQPADYLEQVGMAGYTLYERLFSWPHCLARHLAFYKKILL